ncbi:hypothetical protein F0Q45_23450 [Mycobacterium simiae]|uniref:Uncharacterized protein n=1 Tax=Mycobacterium simiae TaxID=1784 RepID=A0A5B1BGA9_MYCSI|nr:hypothetical protein [Mycobacterium simiae]KAA1246254.1 hypothetical protein F0Q45_23450 [Mycobacterium simiae]
MALSARSSMAFTWLVGVDEVARKFSVTSPRSHRRSVCLSTCEAVFTDQRPIGFPQHIDIVLKRSDRAVFLADVELDLGYATAQFDDQGVLIEQSGAQRWSLRSESALEHLHFLLQLAVSLLCRCEFGYQAVVGDSILGAQMVVCALSARGLVDEGCEVLMPLQEVAVHTGSADDSPPADPPVFASEIGDCFENGGTLCG